MKYLKYILTAVVIVGIIWLAKNPPAGGPKQEIVEDSSQEKREICYIWNTEAGDTATLQMVFTGEGGKDVTGSFYFLPVDKDAKYGDFVGTAGPLDQNTMSRTAKVWWEAKAEGTRNTEELYIKFGDGVAVAGFGEMKDRGDGVYVYATPDDLYYGPNMSQTDCFDEAVK